MRLVACVLFVLTAASGTFAQQPVGQDTRTQYPALLANSFFSINVGRIDYPFSAQQLEPRYRVTSIATPRVTARVVLFGHEFTPYLAAQASYMRPINYVSYRGINGGDGSRSVWMHFGTVTLRPQLPLTSRLTVFGEAGLGITARAGFEDADGGPIVRDANYGSAVFGGGVDYRLTRSLDFTAGAIYVGGNDDARQPRTVFASGGIRYNMRPLPAEQVAANRDAGYVFPRQILQAEITGGVGHGVNTFLSKDVPVFWGGRVNVDRGFALHYTRNVFHTRKVFSLDVGASASFWRSQATQQAFSTLSLYPLLRFTLLRRDTADLYFMYSVAGPSLISETQLDALDTGRRFTFQDFLGVGAFLGRDRRWTTGVKINHYSNGNIFTENAGVKVPLTVLVGYVF
ncbi:MAG: acyloxyacyl hydrolase [Vicinamibacterales bacterium]